MVPTPKDLLSQRTAQFHIQNTIQTYLILYRRKKPVWTNRRSSVKVYFVKLSGKPNKVLLRSLQITFLSAISSPLRSNPSPKTSVSWHIFTLVYVSLPYCASKNFLYHLHQPDIAFHHKVTNDDLDRFGRLYEKVNAYDAKPRKMRQHICHRYHDHPGKDRVKQKGDKGLSPERRGKIRGMRKGAKRHDQGRYRNEICRQRFDFIRSVINTREKASQYKHAKATMTQQNTLKAIVLLSASLASSKSPLPDTAQR